MDLDLEAALAADARWEAALGRGDDSAEEASRAALKGCRTALEQLLARLRDAGYPSVEGLQAVLPERIERARQALPQPVPRIVELFWEEVGSVRLTTDLPPRQEPSGGLFERLFSATAEPRRVAPHTEFFRRRGIERASDALHVVGPSRTTLAWWLDRIEVYREAGISEDFHLGLWPDHVFKDGCSGGGDWGVELGDDDWVPSLGTPEEMLPWLGSRVPALGGAQPDFLRYLRAAVLECAGFPGLLGDPDFEPLRLQLAIGLPAF